MINLELVEMLNSYRETSCAVKFNPEPPSRSPLSPVVPYLDHNIALADFCAVPYTILFVAIRIRGWAFDGWVAAAAVVNSLYYLSFTW